MPIHRQEPTLHRIPVGELNSGVFSSSKRVETHKNPNHEKVCFKFRFGIRRSSGHERTGHTEGEQASGGTACTNRRWRPQR